MFPPHKFSGCLYVWRLHVSVWDLKGGEVAAAGKTTNCGKSAGSSGETPMGVLRRRWVLGLAARFNSHEGGFATAHRQAWEYPPDLLCEPVEEGEVIHLLCGDFKRSRGPQDDREAPPASQVPQRGWVEVSPGAGAEPALSYQRGRAKWGRGDGVSQSIWSWPANSERCLKKQADRGKTAAKLIWERAHMSSESGFEMKLRLVASIPTTEMAFVLLEGTFMCLCVAWMCVRYCTWAFCHQARCVCVCLCVSQASKSQYKKAPVSVCVCWQAHKELWDAWELGHRS